MRGYNLRFTKAELETLTRLLERAAGDASPEQIAELEAIDRKIYQKLFPDLTITRLNATPVPRDHPLPLAHLRLVRGSRP